MWKDDPEGGRMHTVKVLTILYKTVDNVVIAVDP
jgi:hypothetical protein